MIIQNYAKIFLKQKNKSENRHKQNKTAQKDCYVIHYSNFQKFIGIFSPHVYNNSIRQTMVSVC